MSWGKFINAFACSSTKTKVKKLRRHESTVADDLRRAQRPLPAGVSVGGAAQAVPGTDGREAAEPDFHDVLTSSKRAF